MSSRHQEGLAHLLYGITRGGGFVALTGEVGTGKTTLCQCLLQQLPDEVDLALVLNPRLNAVELLATICDELAIAYNKYRQTLKYLVDSLNDHLLEAHAKGRRTVLMIDEAQNLSFPVLEQIRLLTNLETSKQKLLQIILVGQPELQEMLASPQLRQLNQRITARYHLQSLSRSETGLYIKHRLTVSDGDPGLFSPAALRAVHGLSGGIPRLINLICDRALLGAYVDNSRRVTAAIVAQAAREIDSQLLIKQRKRRQALLWAGLLSSVVAAGYYHWPAVAAILSERLQPATLPAVEAAAVSELAAPLTAAAPLTSEAGSDRRESSAHNPSADLNASGQAPRSLQHVLQAPEFTLQQAFADMLALWGLPPATADQCDQLPVNCLADHTTWRELVALNRPVVMEFAVTPEQKRHLLLVAVQDGRPIFRHRGTEIDFALHEVLSLWQGYFLLLWQSPLSAVDLISPGQRSSAVLWLREQLATGQDPIVESGAADLFDSALQQRVETFQQTQYLQADGVVGPRTMIHLQNRSTDEYGPRLRRND